jgi:hypothetical protein
MGGSEAPPGLKPGRSERNARAGLLKKVSAIKPRRDQKDKYQEVHQRLRRDFMRQKTMFLIILILIFGVSCTQALPVDRPETGTYIRDMHRDGDGLLVIYNN